MQPEVQCRLNVSYSGKIAKNICQGISIMHSCSNSRDVFICKSSHVPTKCIKKYAVIVNDLEL